MTITNLLTPEFSTIPKNTKSNEETSKSDQKVAQIWIEQRPSGPLHDFIINPICDFFSLFLKGQDDAAWEKAIQYDKMNDFAFPAVVYKPNLAPSDSSYELSTIFPDLSPELYELLGFLGYRCSIEDDRFHLYLPAVETLNAKWEEYRELHKDQMLPPLKFISSEGIESHEGFIHASFTVDAIISKNIEAVHDHRVHVIALFANVLFFKEKYPVIREKMRDLIRQGCEEPLRFAKEAGLDLPYDELKALEGAIVDSLLSFYPPQIKKEFEESSFESRWADLLIDNVKDEFLKQSDSEKNLWITYFETQFKDYDPKKISHAWMVVQSVDVLRKAHLVSDANIETLERYPDPANLAKAMVELLKKGLLRQRNFELLCQVAPESLSTLQSALVSFENKDLLGVDQFAVLLWSAASLGSIDIVDTLLNSPIAYRQDRSIYKPKVEALVVALDHRQLTCALRLLDDNRLISYLDADVYKSLLEAASDPSMNDLFLKSDFSKSLTQEFNSQLIEAARNSGNFELLKILETRLQKTAV